MQWSLTSFFTDTDQSKSTEQTQLAAAIHSASIGDQLFVESIERLGTNKMDVLRKITEITSRKASVTFVKEDLVFTDRDEPMSMLIRTLLLEFNPPKLLSIKKELHSTVTANKTKKVTRASTVTLTPKQIADLKRRANAGENKTALAKHFAISRESLLLYLR